MLHRGAEVCCCHFDKLRCALLEGLKIKRLFDRVPQMTRVSCRKAEKYDGQLTGAAHQKHEFLQISSVTKQTFGRDVE